jgi:hypothetical protein
MFRTLTLLVLSSTAMAGPLSRTYVEGEKLSYQMLGRNQKADRIRTYEAWAEIDVLKKKQFYESVRWSHLLRDGASVGKETFAVTIQVSLRNGEILKAK